MSLLLQQLDIFELRPVIANISCKLSTITEYCDGRRQLLCLVSEENDIFLRYTNDSGLEVSKVITWFRRLNQVIHDVCFDPSGTWLLVLCFDNTLHILPALSLVDKSFQEAQCPPNQQLPYSITHVTSYIIPFVGPHECPNSQKCPNPNPSKDAKIPHNSKENKQQKSCVVDEDNNENLPDDGQDVDSEPVVDINELADEIVKLNLKEKLLSDSDNLNAVFIDDLEAFSHDVPDEMLSPNAPQEQAEDKTGNSQVMTTSFMASNTCPYPTSIVWWQTMDGVNRAIIGYSDGSICFVGLSPNCPFVASTAVQNGSVVKLNICKDNTFESVMLLITSSMKQQFKLLLEQKAIKYIYPGEISPTSSQPRSNDWQIVMPVKSGSSDASDMNPYEIDAMIREVPFTQVATSDTAVVTTTSVQKPTASISGQSNLTCSSPLPPPYSVALTRNSADSVPVMTAANSAELNDARFQQHPLSDLDDGGRVGILPAARARLASLKSLGSKKLNAIKMRLSDNRHKLEEHHIPDNTHGSFAILDSPSTTPEPLGISGFFYTIQNLRNTYLLSALHCKERTLSVHNIDANLNLLFLYKIPKNCYDILISSNILYSIQYVDIKGETGSTSDVTGAATGASTSNNQPMEANTEKENRDTEMEKEEKYADAKLTEVVDLSEDDKLMQDAVGSDSTDTSATSSGVTANNTESQSNLINAVGVISSAMASFKLPNFNEAAQLGLFRFENETVLNLYQMATYQPAEQTEPAPKEERAKVTDYKDIRSPMDYLQFYETADVEKEYSLRQVEILQNEFPKINYDPCYVVTNKNVYYIQLKKKPFEIFLEAALAGEWNQCREFCTTFDLTYEPCVEFAGDYLLRNRKITQALLTYNNALIKPIRTALKLAMFGQTSTLLLFCAMALKITHILSSKYFCNPIIKTIMKDITYRHSEDVRSVMPPTVGAQIVNEGEKCSDYVYGVDDSISSLQMSPSSQFHLANLLLITLAEKSVNDKNYIPLWNFLVTNTKYHTNMTSIVLCQSGLFSAALILAKTRGVCIDTFLALTSVVNQEFGWYTEVNSCLYNLSEDIFIETLTYLPQVSMEYFCFIQEKLDVIHFSVLKRLAEQLNPFSAAMRPIVSHTSSGHLQHKLSDNNNIFLFEFCKCLIETYLATLIRAEYRSSPRDYIKNALNTFRISYEDNQFAIDSHKFKPISAGCAHCACVVDGIAYFWGSNGVPCSYSANKSSDPPEPPHAVKSLDLLSQLNLEVHAIKCGRQHTLVLTNNGLYAFGNNNLRQLGIGSSMMMALQPVLVKALDGKNITILEAGQYHNAAVADGELYTWGWGVYGQLGHGNIENVDEPKRVEFFKYKKVIQVSLGHAHTLVLCRRSPLLQSNDFITELYVFGSNHFGQLGINTKGSSAEGSAMELNCGTQLKSTVPLKLNVSTANIRLIHTKFFTNIAVDEQERMYTWGSSPQALRLANQIKRRANAKQKNEELQKRSVSKRFEATVFNVVADDVPSTSTSGNESVKHTKGDSNVEMDGKPIVPEPQNVAQNSTGTGDPLIVETTQPTLKVELIDDVEEVIANPNAEFSRLPTEPQLDLPNEDDILDEKKIDFSQPKPKPQEQQQQSVIEGESCEHMTPQLVDTSEIAGEILQVSSGLFHFALISSSCTLYTWGKNLEHQLGTMDKERRAVNKPSPIDSIELPMYVDCGADFTLVMTTEYVVKAFGGNSNGQCGRDLGPTLDKFKQRFVPLPASKRLLRYESQCVEVPVEINLPRPRITLNPEPVRYLKSIPIFQRNFIQEADINFENDDFDRPSPSNQYKSTTQADSSENAMTGQDSDDLISSLENLSNNDACSLNSSLNQVKIIENNSTPSQQISGENTPEEQCYIPLPANDNAEHSGGTDYLNQQPDLQRPEEIIEPDSSYHMQAQVQSLDQQNARSFIHYCLYVFHGLYNPDKVNEFSKEQTEFRIRTAMLNFKFIDAFKLCLQDCNSSRSSLKIFEYFTKDTGYVPMRRQDLKYFIYYLFVHFLANKFDMLDCERFFLGDLEFYLLELAYVLYFNNNNTVLEQDLNQKFKSLIAQEDTNQNEQEHKLNDTDIIFDSLSVKFKTIVCQRLLKHCN